MLGFDLSEIAGSATAILFAGWLLALQYRVNRRDLHPRPRRAFP